MAALSVRVSEDPARPLGHAIVTLSGLPRGLETFEFALSRHGFAANHLGSDGWQGAECWLQPEEAWYSGDALKFIVHPDLVFQLENMPYRLAVRGQGLAETASVTFVWPLQLELEEGSASGERRVVGGTRVDSAPKPRPEPPASALPAVEPPPLPEVGRVDLPIPDVTIPKISVDLEKRDEDNGPTRMVEGRRAREPLSPQDEPTPALAGSLESLESPASGVERPPAVEPTRAAPGRVVPPATSESRQTGEATSAGPVTSPTMPLSTEELLAVTKPGQPVSTVPVNGERRGGTSSRLLIGLILLAALVALVALGWWWFNQHSGNPSIESRSTPLSSDTPANTERTPEPIPTLEPKPAPITAPESTAPAPPPTPPAVIPKIPPTTSPAPSTRPGSGRSLEDELKSQFDPTLQELEKGLRRTKPAP